jgi:hypothetical protein
MSSTEIAKTCELSDAEIDAVSGGGWNINVNKSTITQSNSVGFAKNVEQSNQAVNFQVNQSDVSAWISLRNRQ